MVPLIRTLTRRLWRALTSWPDASGWRFAVLTSAATYAPMAAIGFAGGLLQFGTDYAGLPLRLIGVLFMPALGEEAVFRGLLVPDRSESPRPPWAAMTLATALFTTWHMVETLFLPHAAAIFLRPDFLATVAVEGAGCALIRWRTGSLWPVVAFYWLEVVVWQTWLGGASLAALK